MSETEPKKEYMPYAILVKKLLNKEIIPGLENIIAFDFDFVLDSYIEKYTIFVDARYLNFALKEVGKKLIISNLLTGYNLEFPIYYYLTIDVALKNVKNSFFNLINANQNINVFCRYLDMEKFKNDKKFKTILSMEVSLAVIPQMTVDMLKLIYHTDEKNKNINAVVLLSNNRQLVPAIKELVNNDIAVYLGVSSVVHTPTEMMLNSSAIISLEKFLEDLGAITDI